MKSLRGRSKLETKAMGLSLKGSSGKKPFHVILYASQFVKFSDACPLKTFLVMFLINFLTSYVTAISIIYKHK